LSNESINDLNKFIFRIKKCLLTKTSFFYLFFKKIKFFYFKLFFKKNSIYFQIKTILKNNTISNKLVLSSQLDFFHKLTNQGMSTYILKLESCVQIMEEMPQDITD
jgi:hypothetical protein